jgi:Tol biopolymer transport system component
VKIFARLSILISMCCALAIVGAVLLGRRSSGFSFGYQVAGQPCTIQMVDSERPSASFVVLSRPFCLLNSAWSPNHHYAAIKNFTTRKLSIAIGGNGRDWQDIDGAFTIERSLAWSADSQQIAFLVDNNDVTTWGIIRIENGVPGKPRFFTINGTQSQPYAPPAWSPDGQFIAFTVYDSSRGQGSEELYILNVNSGEIRRLTNNHYRDDAPSWSPDGRQLVFTSAEDGYNELHIIDVTTGERRQLTRFTIGYIPSWSPDGKTIMFMSNIDHFNDLYMISVDGTGLRRLTNNHYFDSVYPIWLFPS